MNIPNKSLFKIDEVCKITGVKPYVLRFWESEFEQISPIQNSNGKKLFELKDINAIRKVKSLLFDEKMTIERAKFELDKIDFEVWEPESESANNLDDIPPIPAEATDPQLETRNQSSGENWVIAKAKLQKMLDLTQSIQERHNW